VAGVAVNCHPSRSGQIKDGKPDPREFSPLIFAEEAPGAEVPLGGFEEDHLRFHFRLGMLAGLGNLGLERRQERPDFPAIERLLRDRFAYFEDDIPHEDPLR